MIYKQVKNISHMTTHKKNNPTPHSHTHTQKNTQTRTKSVVIPHACNSNCQPTSSTGLFVRQLIVRMMNAAAGVAAEYIIYVSSKRHAMVFLRSRMMRTAVSTPFFVLSEQHLWPHRQVHEASKLAIHPCYKWHDRWRVDWQYRMLCPNSIDE